jgi:phospholipid-binding lipoprotein MlaA
VSVRNALYLVRAVDIRSNLLRASTVLDEAALDKYSFTRDAFLQMRRAEIDEAPPSDNDGQVPQEGAEPKDNDGQVPREGVESPAKNAPSEKPPEPAPPSR